MQKISPMLWFPGNAEEAVDHYTSIFKNSKKGAVTYYGAGAPLPKGSVMTVAFQLEGQDFTALNGTPEFKFTEAISLVVNCETQEEIDALWSKLTSGGGAPGPCGWLKDRFGLSWQVVPAFLQQWVGDADPARVDRVMAALMKMTKLDLRALKQAANG